MHALGPVARVAPLLLRALVLLLHVPQPGHHLLQDAQDKGASRAGESVQNSIQAPGKRLWRASETLSLVVATKTAVKR